MHRPIHIACLRGETYAIKKLLLAGENVNVVALNKEGFTPLMACAHIGHIQNVKLLLDHNANIDIVSNQGWKAIHYASRTGIYKFQKYNVS